MLKTIAAFALSLAAIGASAAPAAAGPVWDIKSSWAPSKLAPGGVGLFYFEVRNVGDAVSTEPVTVTAELPPGVTGRDFSFLERFAGNKDPEWTCEGANMVTCTFAEPVGNLAATNDGYAGRLFFPFEVDDAAAPGSYPSVATVSGGGAGAVGDTDLDQIEIGPGPVSFGMVKDSYESDVFTGERKTNSPPARQAGSHPYELRVDFDMNFKVGLFGDGAFLPQTITPQAAEQLKTVFNTLPVGMFGNPEAVPKCDKDDFGVGAGLPLCPPETQVGVIDAISSFPIPAGFAAGNGGFGGLGMKPAFASIPIYNLAPPKGAAADLAFKIGGVTHHIYARLDPSRGYAIQTDSPFITVVTDTRMVRLSIWGVPADPAHDYSRNIGKSDAVYEYGASSEAPIKPFLTLPSDCGPPERYLQSIESYRGTRTATEVAKAEELQITGCDDGRFRFKPEIVLEPTQQAAGAPTGLSVNLIVPQRNDVVQDADELYEQNGDARAIATPPMKKAVVTFPEGMAISPSAAQGLGNCSTAQLALGTDKPVTCPRESQYGTLTLRTPILPDDAPMTGLIYIAKQNDNPFNNFLSFYLVIEEPERGIRVKIPAKIDLDPETGQIKTTFDDLPQFPVSDMEMSFKGGVRAALVNPTTCGTKSIKAEFYSWADPRTPSQVVTDSYDITRKADGSPCVNHLGERPFRPQMEAGTVANSAGSYSPFIFRLQRSDDDQELSQIDVNLPKGLLANISGVTKCPDAGIAQAGSAARSGTEENLFPSCPASSYIGTTDVGAGVGQVLTYVPGRVYLAGPYRGAPLSMVVITPALVGPYDLGLITVRSRIQVNPDTTRASVQTDPFPQIFQGIPVRIRDIRVKVDRPNTIINPTSCDPMEITARATGTGGNLKSTADDTAADLSSRFQASNCQNLPFKPALRFQLKGGTNRGDYPALTATLRGRPGDANIAKTKVTLPHSAFLAQEHIRTVCTRVQFAQEKCPEASIYGHASAKSPLFDQVLEGPVYLRSSSNPLPDLVAKLNGDIDVVLVGRIDSVNQSIRNTFDVVPDAPVEKFVLQMQGGKKGLLQNSKNLCKGRNRADVRMIGQNGKRYNSKPVVVPKGCKGKKRGGGKAKAKAKGGKR